MNIFETDDNSTPLTEEEKQQLKAKWITNRTELNELETKGIADAEIWLLKNKKDIWRKMKIRIWSLWILTCLRWMELRQPGGFRR